jgi:hypothetical protein
MGVYYWLDDHQKKAISYWKKSKSQCDRTDARSELSRIYFEIGKRLSEPKSRYNKINGIKAGEFLEKARTIFEEMNLQWDLNELERLKASNKI